MNKLLLTASLLAVLTACGGGGSGPPPVDQQPIDHQARVITDAADAHAEGITGEGIDIAVIDDFNGNHGNDVVNVIDNIAIDSKIDEIKVTLNGIDPLILSPEEIERIKSADIVNMSYGGYFSTEDFIEFGIDPNWSIKELNDWVIENDLIYEGDLYNNLLVIAAGNEGKDCSTLTECNSEAIYNTSIGEVVIIVGALDEDGNLAHYSNEAGILKDYFIVAPTAGLDGTSFAAPTVTGSAALIMDKFDNTDAEATRDILFKTADDLGEVGVDPIYGHGALNLGRALSPVGEIR